MDLLIELAQRRVGPARTKEAALELGGDPGRERRLGQAPKG